MDSASEKLTWLATGITFAFKDIPASVPITAISGTNAVVVVVAGIETAIDNVDGASFSTGTLAGGVYTVEIRKKVRSIVLKHYHWRSDYEWDFLFC